MSRDCVAAAAKMSRDAYLTRCQQKKTFLFCAIVILKQSNICQDRLGTNIGNAEGKRRFFSSGAAMEANVVRNRILFNDFCANYIKGSVYQDRLETNMGKPHHGETSPKKVCFLTGAGAGGDWVLRRLCD
jgi:hypothetical protein